MVYLVEYKEGRYAYKQLRGSHEEEEDDGEFSYYQDVEDDDLERELMIMSRSDAFRIFYHY